MSRWPNLFLIGAPKCGTTAICDQLGQHPEIFVPENVEPHYFNTDFVGGPGRITDRESYFALYEGHPERFLCDRSTWYLYSKSAVENINNVVPDARVLVSIRNPLVIVRSLFHFKRFIGQEESYDIRTALENETRYLKDAESGKFLLQENYLYREAALFSDKLKKFFGVFGRSRVKVIEYDDFQSSHLDIMRDIYDFIGADPDFRPDNNPVNKTGIKRNRRFGEVIANLPGPLKAAAYCFPRPIRRNAYRLLARLNTSYKPTPPLPDDVAADLRAFFRDDVAALSDLLGRDFSFWLEDGQADQPQDQSAHG